MFCFFFFKQKTAYEMRISDWSSDVCSSDLVSFIVPVLLMLARAVTDRDLDRTWPASAAALRTWDGEGLPSDALARTVAREMLAAHRAGTLNRVANPLNHDPVGSPSLPSTPAHRPAPAAPRPNPPHPPPHPH